MALSEEAFTDAMEKVVRILRKSACSLTSYELQLHLPHLTVFQLIDVLTVLHARRKIVILEAPTFGLIKFMDYPTAGSSSGRNSHKVPNRGIVE